MNTNWILFMVFTGLVSVFSGIPVVYRILYLAIVLYLMVYFILCKNTRRLSVRFDLLNSSGFAGSKHSLTIKIANPSRLPVFWCHLQQAFPEQLGAKYVQALIALNPGDQTELKIDFWSTRRGIYLLPTTKLTVGDPFGLKEVDITFICPEKIIIYPQLISVAGLKIIRSLPQGRYTVLFGLFDDPTRIRGCREYGAGDDTRKIHWPNLARTGNLQVKERETTLNAEIAIFLDLEESGYPVQEWFGLSELGIELAASLLHEFVKQGERVGFYSNGKAVDGINSFFKLPPKSGSEQEKRILTYLAGVSTSGREGFNTFFDEAKRVTVGSCLIFITPRVTPDIAKKFRYLAKAGYHSVFLCLPSKINAVPAGDLKQARIPWFTIERRNDGNVLYASKQG